MTYDLEISDGTPFGDLIVKLSEISEKSFCAQWLIDLEFFCWEMTKNFETRNTYLWKELTINDIDKIKEFSTKCKGWPKWEKGKGVTFVSLNEWEIIYENWKNKKK